MSGQETLTNRAGVVVFEGTTSESGGSQTLKVLAQNGLLGVLAAPPIELRVFSDPLDWQPDTAYHLSITPDTQPSGLAVGSWARPSGDAAHSVQGYAFVSLRSGATEPAWPTDGSGIADGEIQWDTEGELWAGPWQATTALSGLIIKNGRAFISDDGGNSGGSEPDWTAAPNYGDTVTDGAITWTNSGAGATWTANTLYSVDAQGSQYAFSWALPTAPVAGVSYVFSLVGRSIDQRAGTSGATEPSWDTSAGEYTVDDNMIWVAADTSGLTDTSVQAIITGLGIPTTDLIVTLRNIGAIGGVLLVDVANVASDIGTDVLPNTGEGIDNGGSNVLIAPGAAQTLIYQDGAWTPV